MSTTTDQQYSAEQWLDVHFKMSADRKYDSPSNRRLILSRMKSYGVQPSVTAAARATKELAEEQQISRVDGGSEASDVRNAAAAKAASIRQQAEATPLNEALFNQLSRMHPNDVERQYWSDSDGGLFRLIYNRASKEWGFKVPERPMPADRNLTDANDPSEWRTLDANTYYHMEASRIITLYRSDKGFRRAVDRLIQKGLI